MTALADPPVLDGLRVIEFSQLIAPSLCGLGLGDLGADVVKVENPHGDYARRWAHEGQLGGVFETLNRGKRGVVVDLGTPAGRARARALVDSADVVVENLGAASTALGFGYDDVVADAPGLIWCSITGFGHGSDRRAIDQTLQASMGMNALTGQPDGPPLRVPLPVVDIVTGMYATQSILAALLRRGSTGRGAFLDCAMVDAAATLTCTPAALWLTGYTTPRRNGSESDLFVPSAVYETGDGRHVQIVAIGDGHWRAVCRGVGREEWIEDPRFATAQARLAHRREVNDALAEVLLTGTAERWAAAVRDHGGFCEPLRDIADVWADPSVAERGLVTDASGTSLPVASLVPWRDGARVHRAAPRLGEHDEQVFGPMSEEDT